MQHIIWGWVQGQQFAILYIDMFHSYWIHTRSRPYNVTSCSRALIWVKSEVYIIQERSDENLIRVVLVEMKHVCPVAILSNAQVHWWDVLSQFDSFSQIWSVAANKCSRYCNNQQTQEQTWDPSAVLPTTLITLQSHCVYMHTDTVLTRVRLFMCVDTRLTRSLLYFPFIMETGQRRHFSPSGI